MLKDSLHFHLFQHVDKKKKIIAAEDGKLQFVGANYGDLAGASNLARYLVARPTNRKDTDGNTIVELSEAAVFGLETNILGLESKDLVDQKSSKVSLLFKSFAPSFARADVPCHFNSNRVCKPRMRWARPLVPLSLSSRSGRPPETRLMLTTSPHWQAWWRGLSTRRRLICPRSRK